MPPNKSELWIRWTAANALSEFIGLGGTFLAIAFLSSWVDGQQAAGILIAFAIAVVSGAIEATVVGLAQWWAMRPWFPMIGRAAWWRATLMGVLIGYGLGYLPSTLMSLSEAATPASMAEPPPWITWLLAAGLGAVAGAVLSFAQWRVLRGSVRRAGLWIPANMLAWTFGMPVIFWGMDLAFARTALWQSGLIIGGALLAAGAIVGAIHGRFLLLLADLN